MTSKTIRTMEALAITVGLVISGAFASESQAADMHACLTSTGTVVIRTSCKKTEKPLKLGNTTKIAALTGPTGPQGLQGVKGDTGTTGPQGIQGQQGAKGDTGTAGLQGSQGIKGDTGAVGAQGPRGEIGPIGSTGAQGQRGLSGFSEIPQGTTIFGVIGGDFYAPIMGAEWSISESMHAVPPTTYSNEMVVVQNNTIVDNNCDSATCLSNEELTYSNHCTGNASQPTAPGGWICIYPTSDNNADAMRAVAIPSDKGQYGFLVKWTATHSGKSSFKAVWAYTAP